MTNLHLIQYQIIIPTFGHLCILYEKMLLFGVKIPDICKAKLFLQKATQLNTVKHSQLLTLDYGQYSQEQVNRFP